MFGMAENIGQIAFCDNFPVDHLRIAVFGFEKKIKAKNGSGGGGIDKQW